MPGTLFVVAAPIGDPTDLSPRAASVLARVAVVAAEDTRVAKRLCDTLGIRATFVSYHDHNERTRAGGLVERLLAGDDVALFPDQGTPLLSDPGFRLVGAAIEAGVPVVPVPGPSSITAALSGAGLPTDAFLFLGFLPRDKGPRDAVLEERRAERATLVFFEAPHRLVASLDAMARVLGDRPVAVARDLTKRHERWNRGALSVVVEELRAEERVRGEATVVVGGTSDRGASVDVERLENLVAALVDAGVSPGVVRDAVAPAVGASRRAVYQLALARRR